MTVSAMLTGPSLREEAKVSSVGDSTVNPLLGRAWVSPTLGSIYGAEISVCVLVCLYPSDLTSRANCRWKCSRVNAEQLLTPSQEVTGSILGNDMLFFPRSSFFFSLCTRMRISCQCMQHVYAYWWPAVKYEAMEMQFFRGLSKR